MEVSRALQPLTNAVLPLRSRVSASVKEYVEHCAARAVVMHGRRCPQR
jgi:hypothetical protein